MDGLFEKAYKSIFSMNTERILVTMKKINSLDFPTLSNTVTWGLINAKFDLIQDITQVNELLVSNVSIKDCGRTT